MKPAWLISIAAIGLWHSSADARSCESASEALTVISENVAIGSIDARSANCVTEVEYKVSDNGRGPQHVERIVYGDANLPVAYSVKGTASFGGAVDEHYEQSGNSARWTSQADAGEVADGGPRLYLVKDQSPYTLSVYARALLAAPRGRLRTMPDGELRIIVAGKRRFSDGGPSQTVTVYQMDGRDTAPDYVALDEHGRVFAVFSEQILSLRKSWEAQAPRIRAAFEELNLSRLRKLHDQLGHIIDRPLRISNVRVFDADSHRLSALSDVIVKNGKVARIVAHEGRGATSKGEIVVDGGGGVLVPGLHDMHAHYFVDAGLPYLAAGVTTVRDMGNDNAKLLATVAELKAGRLPGPDIVYNGFLEGKGPYSASGGIQVDSVAAALDAVRWYKAHGYWQIKIYNSFHADWVAPVAALAHSLGMGVTGHVPAFATPDQMIDAGYDELVHANQLLLGWLLKPGEDTRTNLRATAMERAADLDLASPAVRATIDHMRRKNIAFDPTLSIREQLMLSRAGQTPPTFAAVIDHFPVGLRREARQTWMPIGSAEADARYRKGYAKVLELTGLLHRSGIRILPGTDDGEGFALHRELELEVAAGMTPGEALANATLGMARYMGRDGDHGSIAPGKVADMFLIAGDPTKDISAVRHASLVIKGGRYYLPEEVYRAINVKPFAASPGIVR